MEKNKKIFIGIVVMALIIIIGVAGYYFYKNNINNNLQSAAAIIPGYPELTSEIIEKMGGREVVDKLIVKFESVKSSLDSAIKKYEDGGKKDTDKPGEILFAEVAKYAQYLRKYDLAISTLESVFVYYDKSDVALLNLAHVYETMGNFQKAIDTYTRFQIMYPLESIDRYYMNVINDYIALGNKEKVIEFYGQYVKAGFKSEEIEQYISKQ